MVKHSQDTHTRIISHSHSNKDELIQTHDIIKINKFKFIAYFSNRSFASEIKSTHLSFHPVQSAYLNLSFTEKSV